MTAIEWTKETYQKSLSGSCWACTGYLLMLDAWLAGTTADVPAREPNALASRRENWEKICRDTWRMLGKRTEVKELLFERLLHLRRHQLKERVWDDDLGSEFGRDQYLGDYREEDDGVMNPARGCGHRATWLGDHDPSAPQAVNSSLDDRPVWSGSLRASRPAGTGFPTIYHHSIRRWPARSDRLSCK